MMAEGGCDSRTEESKWEAERVSEGIEWDARARSLMMNSARQELGPFCGTGD
jgi:hypothetical protein